MPSKKRKIPNGLGSITKVSKTSSGKRRLKPYRARLPAIYDENGKAKRKDIGFFKTYNEAYEALQTYQEPSTPITFKEIYIKYTETKDFKDKTKNTQNRYNLAFNRFKALHNKNIHDIVYSDLQEVIDTMEDEGYWTTKNGKKVHEDYSSSSLNRLKILISKIYTLAIKNNILDFNLAPYLEIGGIKSKRKKDVFTKEEIESIYSSIPHNKNAMHILVMIFTGMRTGEYLNLKIDNIDFKNNIIKDFGIKTEAGKKRVMYIHPKIKDILKYLVNKSKSGYVLENEKGKTIIYDKYFYDKVYYPALEKAGVKRKIPYTCRYTFATIAHYSGVTDTALQKLMGHTNFQVTADSYIQDLDAYVFEEFKKINI